MKVAETYSIYRFKQPPWLAEYINHNTQLRIEAKTNIEKDFIKLMNNAFFGKTMETIRDRVNLELISHPEKRQKTYR